jgi:hypothetical protein
MVIESPKPKQILDIALDFELDLSEEDARSFAGLIAGLVPSYNPPRRVGRAEPAGEVPAHPRPPAESR